MDSVLSQSFIDSYKTKTPPFGFNGLGYVVYKRTYSRQKEDGTNEEWYETVARCVNGAQKIGAGYTREEAERLFDHVFNLRCNFAGRMLWQLGTPTVERFGGNSMLNCWGMTVSEPKSFLFLFENLMLGGGVGFSVRREDVHGLPRVKKGVTITHLPTKDADFIVPDSRQGWIKLLGKVLDAYYVTGKSFTYSTILVRGAGEKIHGFGGTASGPQILIEGMQKIAAILKGREEKKLRSIDALDICNVIGSIVVAGNVRRSAEIALGDPDDYLYLRAKNWSLGNIPNHRAMSNNTIYADGFDHISDEIWTNGYALDPATGHAKGEPYGFFNLPLSQRFGRLKDGPMKDSDLYPTDRDNCAITNPCQPAWAPVLTPNGLSTMGQIKVGDRIWSQTGWTTVVKKWSTGVKPVYRYQTTAGVFFGTENHRVLSNGEKVEARYAESIDRLSGPYIRGLTVDPQDVMDGMVFGDGSVHAASNDLVHLCIGKDDGDYHHSEVARLIRECRPGLHQYAWEVITTITADELPLIFNRSIPERFVYASPHKVAGFLRGLYTANGSIVADRITLKASSFKVIEQVQMMLSSLGIASHYTTNRPTRVQFSNGEYLCKESYDLNITRDRATFAALIGFIQLYKVEKVDALLKRQVKHTKSPKVAYDVTAVTQVSEEEVFDITVDNAPHTYWTGGVNVSNCAEISLAPWECCNLSELYLNNISSKEQLIDCAKLLYKTQKAIAAMPFLHEETNEIVHKNMRLGLGVTGVCQALDKLDWLDECYIALRQFDAEWSKQRGWPRSIKLTTVKPSGCSRKDHLVLTSNGLLRLDEIGDIHGAKWQDIADLRSTENTITKFYVNGRVKTRILRTEDGFEYESSLNHRYWVNGDWKYVADLQVGDALTAQIGGYSKVNEPTLVRMNQKLVTNAIEIRQPTNMSPDLAFFIGLFYADGSVHEKGVRISFNRRDNDLICLLKRIIDEQFSLKAEIDDDHGLYVNSTFLVKWFAAQGILKNYCDQLELPRIIRQSSVNSVKAFIAGFWRGDGGQHNQVNWSVCTVTQSFARDLAALMRAVGYNVSIRNAGPGGYGSLDRWIVQSRDVKPNRYQGKELRTRFLGDGQWSDRIVEIVDSESDTYDIEVAESHRYILNGCISHNTLSLLGGATPGVHPAYSQYYIRRVRMASSDKLAKQCRDAGYVVEYARNFDGSEDRGTLVVEFPCQTPAGAVLAEDMPVLKQLDMVAQLQSVWSDNAVSVTAYYDPAELPALKAWLKENYEKKVKSVSFLLREKHGFQQAPYESITKERYEQLVAKITPLTQVSGGALENLECSSGACPIR